MNGGQLSVGEIDAYKTFIMTTLAKSYAKRNIAMQLHFSAIRDCNQVMFEKLGPDTGFDATHDVELAEGLCAFLKTCPSPTKCRKQFFTASIQRIIIR